LVPRKIYDGNLVEAKSMGSTIKTANISDVWETTYEFFNTLRELELLPKIDSELGVFDLINDVQNWEARRG
jgi:hypothetical protein